MRLCENSVESDTFCGDFMAKLLWRLCEVLVEKAWEMKLPDDLHINFTIKFQ